jgi:hypothetical protein
LYQCSTGAAYLITTALEASSFRVLRQLLRFFGNLLSPRTTMSNKADAMNADSAFREPSSLLESDL